MAPMSFKWGTGPRLFDLLYQINALDEVSFVTGLLINNFNVI